MSLSGSEQMLALLVLPLVCAILLSLAGKSANLRDGITLVTSLLVAAVAWSFGLGVADGSMPALVLAEPLPGLELGFRAEPLGAIFVLVAGTLWPIASLYSIGYMRGNNEGNQTRFFACFAISISATMGVALAQNLFSLFVFYEVLTLATYPLVAHHGDEESKRGAKIYLVMLLSTSIGLLLTAILWTHAIAGHGEFEVGGLLAGKVEGPLVGVLLALYAFGIGKAALMPLHAWLPSAMVAPTPVSALLHAVAVVKAGVFCVIKVVVYVFGLDLLSAEPSASWLAWVAGASILIASAIALRQDNLKRRLAFSTVSQLAYVTMAAALVAPLSIMAAAIHIVAHAFGKITLFFAAGAIYTAAHKTNVSQMDGIGRKMPWTMGAFAIASLSMIGLPPTVGFVSKWYLLSGAMQAQADFAIAVLILSTLLNAGYFLPILYRAFTKPVAEDASGHTHGEAPKTMVWALSTTALVTIVLFFAPDWPVGFATQLVGG